MKNHDTVFFAIIYAIIFIPVAIMLFLVGTSSAMAETPMVTPYVAPTSTPGPMATMSPDEIYLADTQPTPMPVPIIEEILPLIAPEPIPAIVNDPTNEPSLFDDSFIMEMVHIIPLKAGENRTITLTLRGNSEGTTTYYIIPNSVISDVDEDEPDSVKDDWVRCIDEWNEIELNFDEEYEVKFDIMPPKDISGEYQFNYMIMMIQDENAEEVRKFMTISVNITD